MSPIHLGGHPRQSQCNPNKFPRSSPKEYPMLWKEVLVLRLVGLASTQQAINNLQSKSNECKDDPSLNFCA
eukprot:12426784-Karenia_brevis.AAC.1